MVVYVTVKEITGIALTGSGDVYFKDGLTADNLRLHLTGSGDVSGKLTAKTLESSITGSGDIKISGHADNSKVSVTGSGDYSARNLTTTKTVAHVGGSGDADVSAEAKALKQALPARAMCVMRVTLKMFPNQKPAAGILAGYKIINATKKGEVFASPFFVWVIVVLLKYLLVQTIIV